MEPLPPLPLPPDPDMPLKAFEMASFAAEPFAARPLSPPEPMKEPRAAAPPAAAIIEPAPMLPAPIPPPTILASMDGTLFIMARTMIAVMSSVAQSFMLRLAAIEAATVFTILAAIPRIIIMLHSRTAEPKTALK